MLSGDTPAISVFQNSTFWHFVFGFTQLSCLRVGLSNVCFQLYGIFWVGRAQAHEDDMNQLNTKKKKKKKYHKCN